MSKTKVDSTGIDLSDTFAFTGTTTGVTSLSTATGSPPSYSARAFINFNGEGTVAIRASGNVSSLTDNGTGDYSVNFSTNMPDVNYTVLCSCGQATDNVRRIAALGPLGPSGQAFNATTAYAVGSIRLTHATAAYKSGSTDYAAATGNVQNGNVVILR